MTRVSLKPENIIQKIITLEGVALVGIETVYSLFQARCLLNGSRYCWFT